MSNKHRPTYDSQRDRDNYTFHPGRLFRLTWDPDPGKCCLYVLSDRQVAMLSKMLQILPKYQWVWGLPSPRREWDVPTQDLWEEISTFVEETEACLVSDCDLTEFTRAIRQLNAIIAGELVDLTQPIPDEIDYTGAGNGVLPTLHEHLQALGPIPKQGDDIMTSLQKLVDLGGWTDDTVDQLIAKISNIDPGASDSFGDLAEMLQALKALFPGTARVRLVTSFYERLQQRRWWHNHLTIQAYQATALRGIQRSIAPFDDDGTTDEGILKKIGAVPWLARAVVAVLEPTPGGEIYLFAETLKGVAQTLFTAIQAGWNFWWNAWVDRVQTPVPVDTVTGGLSAIVDALNKIQPESEADLPPDFTALFAALSGAVNNVASACNMCGQAPCVCPGGQTRPGDQILDTDPAPDLGDPNADPPPDGFDTWQDYDDYKCMAANFIYDSVYQFFAWVAGLQSALAGAGAGAATGTLILALINSLIAGFAASYVAGGAFAGATLAGAVLFTAPAWIVEAIVVLVIAMIVTGVGLGVLALFQAMVDELDQETIVCDLYLAQSVSEARGVLSTAIGDAIATFAIDPPYNSIEELIRATMSQVIGHLLSNAFLNQLFQESEYVNAYTGDVDCSGCGEACLQEWNFEDDIDGFVITDESDPEGEASFEHDNDNDLVDILCEVAFPTTGPIKRSRLRLFRADFNPIVREGDSLFVDLANQVDVSGLEGDMLIEYGWTIDSVFTSGTVGIVDGAGPHLLQIQFGQAGTLDSFYVQVGFGRDDPGTFIRSIELTRVAVEYECE
jgi:hypothetical protein